MAKKNIVYDLDGTISTVNTYKVFMIVFLGFIVCTLQISLLIVLLKTGVLYAKKELTRWEFKKELYLLYHKRLRAKNTFNGLLVAVIKLFLRKELYASYTQDKENNVVLATAAYDFYSELISKELNFSSCLSTTYEDILNDFECIQENKLNRVKEHLNGEEVDLFFTDHKDDIPLIKEAKKTFLIHPSPSSKEKVMSLGLDNIDYSFA